MLFFCIIISRILNGWGQIDSHLSVSRLKNSYVWGRFHVVSCWVNNTSFCLIHGRWYVSLLQISSNLDRESATTSILVNISWTLSLPPFSLVLHNRNILTPLAITEALTFLSEAKLSECFIWLEQMTLKSCSPFWGKSYSYYTKVSWLVYSCATNANYSWLNPEFSDCIVSFRIISCKQFESVIALYGDFNFINSLITINAWTLHVF